MYGVCNLGVYCDVKHCVHNKNGTRCELDTIKVTMQGRSASHFCESYERKF